MKKNKKQKESAGYALLETIFYIALFVAISVAVVNSIVVMSRAFRETSLSAKLLESARMTERISREIRGAESVNTISATSLKLNTKDADGADKTVEFSLSGANLRFLENEVFIGNLNPNGLSVDAVSFGEISTAQSVAVKFSLSVSSDSDPLGRTEIFQNTVVLRGSYP